MVYFILISLPYFFHIFNKKYFKDHNNILWFFCYFIFLFFLGFRFEIGGDWFSYLNNYETGILKINKINLSDLNIFYITKIVFQKLNLNYYTLNFFLSFIFLTSLFYFCNLFKFKWIALLSTMPYLTLIVSTGYIRQTVAISFLFFFLGTFYRKLYLTKYIHIIFAIFSHISSLIFVFFLLTKKNFIIILSITLLFLFAFHDDFLTFYNNYLVSYSKNSKGFLFRLTNNVIYLIIPIYLLIRVKLKEIENKVIIFNFIVIVSSILLYFLNPNSSTFLDRMNLYNLIFTPIYINLIIDKKLHIPYLNCIKLEHLFFLIYLYSLIYFFIWTKFGNAYSYWQNYDNIILNGFSF